MDEAAISQYISETFEGVEVVLASGDAFFFNSKGGAQPADRRQPFATLVTSDAHDTDSNLDRPGVFRLNIGTGRDTFRALFGQDPTAGEEGRYDLTALDQIMPHPVYGNMFWICVLNPSPETFERIKPLLAEAYDLAGVRAARARRG